MTFAGCMTMAGRLVVICAAVELMVVVVVNSVSLQSADVITARQQQQQQQPCISEACSTATASASAGLRRRPRRRTDSAAASSDSMSDRLDNDSQKRRAQQKAQPPRQNVTIEDKSVAEALALAADVGRGPPLPPPQDLASSKLSTDKPPASSRAVKPATSGGSGSSKGGDTVNVMLALGCEAEPCQHGGVCYTDAFSPRGFSCRCAAGYYGDVCEYGWWHCLRVAPMT